MPEPAESDIARHLKTIAWLQADLLGSVATLFKSMADGGTEHDVESLAGLVMAAYLLGRRLGVPFARLDLQIETRLRQLVAEGHTMERGYGDLSALARHFSARSEV